MKLDIMFKTTTKFFFLLGLILFMTETLSADAERIVVLSLFTVLLITVEYLSDDFSKTLHDSVDAIFDEWSVLYRKKIQSINIFLIGSKNFSVLSYKSLEVYSNVVQIWTILTKFSNNTWKQTKDIVYIQKLTA